MLRRVVPLRASERLVVGVRTVRGDLRAVRRDGLDRRAVLRERDEECVEVDAYYSQCRPTMR